MEDIQQPAANTNNVLFEPEIYRQQNEQFEEAVSVAPSNRTTMSNFQGNSYGAVAVTDPKLLVAQRIRCCVCGTMCPPNPANTCISCLKQQIDITEGISKTGQLKHCRECNRYLAPPWRQYELESSQLLALCLKNIKGLKRVKLMESRFLYTEPHSRRIKLRLTVQAEAASGTYLQQTFGVEFVVNQLQCDDCKQSYTPHNWVSQVQVRQRVLHKRTFLYLEQLILRHNAQEKAINIQENRDGLDFHYKSDAHSRRIIQFILYHFVARHRQTKQLVSHNEQNAEYFTKYTNFVELAPVCRDDLVLLEPKLQKALGGIGPLILIYKVTTCLHVVDIKTMQTHEIANATYWGNEFGSICSRERLSEFVVLGIDEVDFDVDTSKAAIKNKFRMVQVELARADDFGVVDRTFITHTHLGEFINFNDTVLCYDLNQINLNELEEYESTHKFSLPDVVIVKKTYPRIRKRQARRIWKLNRLDMVKVDEHDRWAEKKQKKRDRTGQVDNAGQQMNEFMAEIEEDPAMRANINMYKDDAVISELEQQMASMTLGDKKDYKSPLTVAQEEGQAKVSGEQRKIVSTKRKTKEGQTEKEKSELRRAKNDKLFKATLKKENDDECVDEDDEWQDLEEDFPNVKLEELMDNLKIDSDHEEEKDE